MIPIQIASQRSGVSSHVIRIWERRYGALAPARTGTNRRMYSEEEVRRLRLLRELTERGHRIGGVAELPMAELERLALEERGRRDLEVSGRGEEGLTSSEDFVQACLEAARSFEGDNLRRLIQRARQQFGQRGMLRLVLTPLIHQLGSAWQEGNLRSSQEHLGTEVIRETLMAPVPGSSIAPGAPEVVVATPSGEVHELGALLVAASARDLGWRVTYLGPNLPAEEIAACASARGARAVAVSLVYPDSCPGIRDQLRELRHSLPEGTALIVGGRSAASYQKDLAGPGIEWAGNLAGLDRILVSLG